jgi:CheY-like chemotaxis protein
VTGKTALFEILFVDDDAEVLEQLKELLPETILEYQIAWECCGDFAQALELLQRRRFDILVSDIYRGRDKGQKNIAQGDIKAKELVDEVRQKRFCPIVLFTDGQLPAQLITRPFVWSADKAAPDFMQQLTDRLTHAVNTGLPHIARQLHDELDRYAGSYVWEFLAGRWDVLKSTQQFDSTVLERIIRRRAAMQLGRLDGETERNTDDPVDFYIYPPLGEFMRLGEIIKEKSSGNFRVVLTPHCFLVKQPGQDMPRANYVLTTLAIPLSTLALQWKTKNAEFQDQLRRRTGMPASRVPLPDGRYCFLPAFLDIPDLYCDLLRVESIEYSRFENEFDRIAALDAPYAEALQSCFARLHGAVGVPVLNLDRVQHLRPQAKTE